MSETARRMCGRVSDVVMDEIGESRIEYALIAAMVVVALGVFLTPMSNAISIIFTAVQSGF
jgi:Flp pilus assembly pilin Flp